jgi:hypothetical protein
MISSKPFYYAIETLASSSAPIQDRLREAWIILMSLQAEDLDEDLRAEFVRLQEEVTSIDSTGDEGRLHATTSQMKDDAAETHARALFRLFCKVLESFRGP